MGKKPAFSINKRVIADNFGRAAKTYEQAAILQKEVGNRLLDRLEFIKINPLNIVDLGCGTGYLAKKLSQHFPTAYIVNLDIAFEMVRQAKNKLSRPYAALPYACLCADAENLPFENNSVDFVFSNCTFQWFPDPALLFQEIIRILKPNGLLLFSTFGPDTLQELRTAFQNIDPEPHVNTFMDMHDLGDILLATQFEDPVVDKEIITVTYPDIYTLMRDLKQTGANTVHRASNLNSGKNGLSPKGYWEKLKNCYEHYRASGVLPATFEVVYGHAWKGELSCLAKPDKEGVAYIPLTHIQRL